MRAFRKEGNKYYGKKIEVTEMELGNINYFNIMQTEMFIK
jgi:hypothetical protein